MRLVLENDFTWDGIYNIIDETGDVRFTVDAGFDGSARKISLFNADEKLVGGIREKKFKWHHEYDLFYGDMKLGSISRRMGETDYDVEIKGWMVSGDIPKWNFRVVDRRGDVAESGFSVGNLAIEVYDDSNAIQTAVLMLGLAGIRIDTDEEESQSALHEVADVVEKVADKTSRFGQKAWDKLEKLYGLEDENEGKTADVPEKEKIDLHEVVDAVENIAEKTSEFGKKTWDKLEKMYGLDKEPEEDTGRK